MGYSRWIPIALTGLFAHPDICGFFQRRFDLSAIDQLA